MPIDWQIVHINMHEFFNDLVERLILLGDRAREKMSQSFDLSFQEGQDRRDDAVLQGHLKFIPRILCVIGVLAACIKSPWRKSRDHFGDSTSHAWIVRLGQGQVLGGILLQKPLKEFIFSRVGP